MSAAGLLCSARGLWRDSNDACRRAAFAGVARRLSLLASQRGSVSPERTRGHVPLERFQITEDWNTAHWPLQPRKGFATCWPCVGRAVEAAGNFSF